MNPLTQTTSKDIQDADLRGRARVQEMWHTRVHHPDMPSVQLLRILQDRGTLDCQLREGKSLQ